MTELDRRSFLRLGAATGVAGALPGLAATANANTTPATGAMKGGVQRYVRLGRTELQISDISFGSSRLRMGEERLVDHAFDLGVNYYDTAESYTRGASETVLGNALVGKRDKVYLASKMIAGPSTRAGQLMSALEGSLERLRTDYVDIFFNHAVNDVDALKNPEWFEFVEKAKRQGKIRFTGMSGHAGYLAECVEYAVSQDMFDTMLLAQNFGEDPSFFERVTKSFDFVANQQSLPNAMLKAREKDVGIVAMKVLRGARLNDMRPYEAGGDTTFAQAAFKWTLNTGYVDAAIISMTSTDQIDEYLGASGAAEVTDADLDLLKQYAAMTDATYCRHACNDCAGACPYNVPMADVLRTRMYATDYGDFSFARDEYAALDVDASACLTCDGSPCAGACTHDIDIAKLCAPTHQMLS